MQIESTVSTPEPGAALRTVIESTLAKAGGHLGEGALAKASAKASGVALEAVAREIRQMVTYGQLWAREKGRGRTIYALGADMPTEKASSLAMDGPGPMDTVGQSEAFRKKAQIREAVRQILAECGHKGELALTVGVAQAIGIGLDPVGLEIAMMVQCGELHRKANGHIVPLHGTTLATQDTPHETTRARAPGLPQVGAAGVAATSTPPEQEGGKDGQGGASPDYPESAILTAYLKRKANSPPQDAVARFHDLELTPAERFKIQFLRIAEEHGIEVAEAIAGPIGAPWDEPGPLLYRVGVAVGLLDGSLYREGKS